MLTLKLKNSATAQENNLDENGLETIDLAGNDDAGATSSRSLLKKADSEMPPSG